MTTTPRLSPANAPLRMETHSLYRIVVQGNVNPAWKNRLEGMSIVRYQVEHIDTYISVLTGRLTDQATLIGILNFLYDTGYPLIAVDRLEAYPLVVDDLAERP